MPRPEDDRSTLRVELTPAGNGTLMALSGTLDGTSYRSVRDALVKAALNDPAMIVVDVSHLHVPQVSAWSVFTSARWLIKDWPEVPLALVCSHESGRQAVRLSGAARYVPVYARNDDAIAAITSQPHPPRRRVRQSWPADRGAVPAAQGFVAHWLSEWSMDDRALAARVAATVLVENVLRHTDSAPDLRLETDGDTLVVAVTDDCGAVATIREDDELRGAISELNMLQAVTRLWGNTPTASGKVVWAVIGPENRL